MKKQIHANTHSRRRIMAFVLAFCLFVAMLPTVSFAADKPQGKPIPYEIPGTSTRDMQGTHMRDGKRLKVNTLAQETPMGVSGDFEYVVYAYWDKK